MKKKNLIEKDLIDLFEEKHLIELFEEKHLIEEKNLFEQ